MTRRVLILILLVVAACAPREAAPITSVSTTSTTEAPAVAPEARALVYGHVPGDVLDYTVSVSQDIAFDASGDAGGIGDSPLPIDADLITESTGSYTQVVTPGPEPDTVEVAITAAFPATNVAGTVNGAAVDSLEEGGIESDLARIDPVDVVALMTPTGHVVDDEDESPAVAGADLAALTGLTNDLFSRPLGPVFPAGRDLSVGATWQSLVTRRGPDGPVSIRSESEILDVQDDIWTIRTVEVTEPYDVDFSEQFRRLFRGFAGLDEDEEVPSEVQVMLDSIEFTIEVAGSETTSTVEFDATRGVVTSADEHVRLDLTMTFRAPDEATGEVVGFDIVLDIAQSAVFRIVD